MRNWLFQAGIGGALPGSEAAVQFKSLNERASGNDLCAERPREAALVQFSI